MLKFKSVRERGPFLFPHFALIVVVVLFLNKEVLAFSIYIHHTITTAVELKGMDAKLNVMRGAVKVSALRK